MRYRARDLAHTLQAVEHALLHSGIAMGAEASDLQQRLDRELAVVLALRCTLSELYRVVEPLDRVNTLIVLKSLYVCSCVRACVCVCAW